MPPPSATSRSPRFTIVLHEPEIPNNTGNIGRTCMATGCNLVLIRPLGFSTDEKACRRAGLDYWPRLQPRERDSWEDYQATEQPPRVWLFTTKTSRPVWDVEFAAGDHLIFGRETRGLPPSILEAHPDRLVTLPMAAGERSLNLATAVCAAAYEGLRQLRASGALTLDASGRLHSR